MSLVHLDFSEDRLPGSERKNEDAHADFDWEGLFSECDGVLAESRSRVEERDYTALGEAVTVVLRAILAARDNHQRGWLECVGRKAIAVAFTFNPELLDGVQASRLAAELEVSKQSFNERSREVRAFIRRHPMRKPKVVAAPMGDGVPSQNENQPTENLPVDGGTGAPYGPE